MRFSTIILGLIFASAISTSVQAAGKIKTDSIKSKVLNVWVKYNVYLPDGFENGNDKYPVLYLLHGLTNDYTSWSERGRVEHVAELQMRSGESDKMVILMPNAGGKDVSKIRNGYFNVEGWNYEDFFFNEFIPEMEKKYRVIGDKGHRAISGLSMGGGGSLSYSFHHPEMFCACYAMSAWVGLGSRNSQMSSLPAAAPKRESARSDIEYATYKSVYDNLQVPYLQKADEAKINELKTLKWYIDVGDDDFLLDANYNLYREMLRKRLPVQFRVRDGGHVWEYWHTALFTALPFFSRNFTK